MCGRFTLTGSLIWLFRLLNLDPLDIFADRFNIAPTQPVLALLYDSDRNCLRHDFLNWGLVPPFVEDPRELSTLINARAETLAEKPSFRNAFRYRRCVIPASGFYEWKREGKVAQPYYFSADTEQQLCLAGIWEIWHGEGGEQVNSCAIITVTANNTVSPVHHRMPAILEPRNLAKWLAPDAMATTLHAMLRPASPHALACRRVSRLVNSIRADSPACIEPEAKPAPFQPTLFNNDS
ncbi:MAG TPA: SOS response-associated peptidase [Candidatus Rifleibacterium sp.]|nr:SOS response-associated peptidase [Candidatus Rifleibacterium sp.]HPT46710.1 SOS response-associated peptidase [Candidatus Rifleibacterium sp.]